MTQILQTSPVAVFFKTYGCQANVADSAGLATYLEGLGCVMADSAEAADLIIINTCAIREKAEQKLYSYIGELAPLKEKRAYMRVGIIGCVASYRKQEMLKRFDHVSFVSGARDEQSTFLAYMADVIVQLQTAKQLFVTDGTARSAGQDRQIPKVVAAKKLLIPKHMPEAATKAALGGTIVQPQEVKRAFINITTGCNNYCTYCIVPFTRGREVSYAIEELVMRVEHEVAAGAKEITLIGQNVNSYTCPETGKRFAALLEAVAQVPGEFWVRYISPHPKDMTNDVLEAMAKYPDKLCHWCHFPLQAGSTRVLDLMNRTYSKEEYLAQVDNIRGILPDATITTDIIVGFPGETHEEYLETREVMELVRFDLIFSFIYSRRKYTKAYKMGDTCPAEEKQARLEGLQARHREIGGEQNKQQIGKTVRVLVEKRVSTGKLLARTAGNHRVFFEGADELIGTFTYVLIADAGVTELRGSHAPHGTLTQEQSQKVERAA